MRILVTGADGFIGQHLVKRLKDNNHDVVCHELKEGDLSEKTALDKYDSIDYMYHLAACTYVPSSWENTFDYFKTNIMGTVTALEYCRRNNCGITVMSTYVYGEPKYLPVDEAHPVCGTTPYHESKLIDEQLCRFYSEKFSIVTTVFRPFNVYGKGQNDVFLMPKIVNQVMDTKVKEVQVMDLEPKRDYVYISDVVEALLCAMKRKHGYEVYNIGSGVSTSVEEVIKLIMQVSGIKKPYYAAAEKRQGEISDCVADIRKIKNELGFVPRYSLRQGIEEWINEIGY